MSSSSAVTSCLAAILTWPPHCIFPKYCQFTLPYQAFISLSSSPVYDQFPVSLDFSLDCTFVCLPVWTASLCIDPTACFADTEFGFVELFNKPCIWILLRLPPQLHYITTAANAHQQDKTDFYIKMFM